MSTRSSYDAIVVGARCAGAPTAMLLARRGLRVLLVDKARFPSDTLGTHFMHPRGSAYLMKWGVWGDVVRSNATTWNAHTISREGIGPLTGATPARALEARFRDVHGWDLAFDGGDLSVKYTAPRRKVLDQLLIEAATAAGVEFREQVTLDELIFDGDSVRGIRCTTSTGERFEERAPVVVGADGRHSRVAREVRASKSRERSRCTYCYWTYWADLSLEKTLGVPSALFVRGRLAISTFPSNDGLVHMLVMGPCEWFSSFKTNVEANYLATVEFCAPALREALSGARRAERIYGTADQPQRFHESHGRGWALVGDAGYNKDQCTAIGMTHAFRDAELLAKAIHDGLADERTLSLDEALADYVARRDRDAIAYYDYVCRRAECNVPTFDDLKLLAALRGNAELIDDYFGTVGDAIRVEDFYTPENLHRIRESARQEFLEPDIFRDFEMKTAGYALDPWVGSGALASGARR